MCAYLRRKQKIQSLALNVLDTVHCLLEPVCLPRYIYLNIWPSFLNKSSSSILLTCLLWRIFSAPTKFFHSRSLVGFVFLKRAGNVEWMDAQRNSAQTAWEEFHGPSPDRPRPPQWENFLSVRSASRSLKIRCCRLSITHHLSRPHLTHTTEAPQNPLHSTPR